MLLRGATQVLRGKRMLSQGRDQLRALPANIVRSQPRFARGFEGRSQRANFAYAYPIARFESAPRVNRNGQLHVFERGEN